MNSVQCRLLNIAIWWFSSFPTRVHAVWYFIASYVAGKLSKPVKAEKTMKNTAQYSRLVRIRAIGRNIFPNVAQMRLKREHVDVLFHFRTRPLPFVETFLLSCTTYLPTFSPFHAAALLQSGMNKRERKSSEIKWKEHEIFFFLLSLIYSISTDYTRKVMRNISRWTLFRFGARWD